MLWHESRWKGETFRMVFDNRLFVPVSVVSQQDLVLEVRYNRNVGQPMRAETVHSAVSCCSCSAEWLQDFRPYYTPRTKSRPSEMLLYVTAIHQRYDESLCSGRDRSDWLLFVEIHHICPQLWVAWLNPIHTRLLKTLDAPVVAAAFSPRLHLQSGW